MEIFRDVGFVHLHVHSSYSLREGALTIARLAKLAIADNQPALAITDTNNLFGALEFSEKLAKDGVQPIVGVQLAIDFGDRVTPANGLELPVGGNGGLVLLARNEAGYESLMRLVTRAWLGSEATGEPRAALAALAEETAGLIALTGGPAGPIDSLIREGQIDLARARLDRLKDMFGGRLYVELQRHDDEAERAAESYLKDMAYRGALPLVATNEPYFAARSDFEAHDALLCISDGAMLEDDARRRLTPEHRFKTRAEMRALFADLPEATDNSVAIALRCSYRPKTRKPILPRFTTGDTAARDAEAAEAAELRRQAEEGLKARLTAHPPAHEFTVADYEQRLAFELDVIEKMKFPGYFLIVADFIKYAKEQGIPVGPGRGSGAGSLVDYALAPEHPYPAAIDQCNAVARWAHANAAMLGIDPARIAVGGDSAGGNLAAALALDLRGSDVPLIAQLLIYPACDFDRDRPSYAENAEAPLLQVKGMDTVNAMYSPDTAQLASNPRIAPLVADSHAGLPPAFIAVAQNDPLRDSGLAYAAALEAAGVPVVLDRGAGLIHGYLRAMEWCEASRTALHRMADWLKAQG